MSDSAVHRTSITLTTDPARHPFVFAAAFNSGDPDLIEEVYEAEGVLVASSGVQTGLAERRAANARLQALGVPIEVRPRHVYTAGDLALLIVDWAIKGHARDGQHVQVEGTATDVVRRGRDGKWRYVIDNPFGTA